MNVQMEVHPHARNFKRHFSSAASLMWVDKIKGNMDTPNETGKWSRPGYVFVKSVCAWSGGGHYPVTPPQEIRFLEHKL